MQDGVTMKKRKFAPGGSVSDETYKSAEYQADKAAGLKASEGDEKVGFWKRIMMGNIDDPSSEAYKKFGAGRGQAERQKMKDDADFAAEEAREATMRKVSGEDVKMTGSPDIPVTPAMPIKTGAPVKKPQVKVAPSSMKGDVEKFNSTSAKPNAIAMRDAALKRAGEMKAKQAADESAKAAAEKTRMADAAKLAKELRAKVPVRADARPGYESPMAPTKANAAAKGNKLTSDRYKGRRAGFDAKMQKTTAGKTTGYKAGGSVKGSGIAQRGVKKCKMV